MKDTIKARTGYRVINASVKRTGEKFSIINDGDIPLFIAKKRSFEDYECEMSNNESATTCEIFTTVKGNQFIYWRDDEIDEDYITRVK